MFPYVSEYFPAGHFFEHLAVTNPRDLPYVPGGQSLQSFTDIAPCKSPYLPAGHISVHLYDISPIVSPYLPRGHETQPSSLCDFIVSGFVIKLDRYFLEIIYNYSNTY